MAALLDGTREKKDMEIIWKARREKKGERYA
jgi:hypothetical protein